MIRKTHGRLTTNKWQYLNYLLSTLFSDVRLYDLSGLYYCVYSKPGTHQGPQCFREKHKRWVVRWVQPVYNRAILIVYFYLFHVISIEKYSSFNFVNILKYTMQRLNKTSCGYLNKRLRHGSNICWLNI